MAFTAVTSRVLTQAPNVATPLGPDLETGLWKCAVSNRLNPIFIQSKNEIEKISFKRILTILYKFVFKFLYYFLYRNVEFCF